MMDKAPRIRELLQKGLEEFDIAKRVGCGEPYVRTVRQRTSASGNPIRSPAYRAWYARQIPRRADNPDYQLWGEKEDAFLRREYGKGRLSVRWIAEHLGRTRNEVIGRAHRLRLGQSSRAEARAS